MAIDSTYKTLLLENYIKEQLQQGESISASDLITQFESLNEKSDFTKPQFDLTQHEVEEFEEASAQKFNNTFSAIRQDLNVLYKWETSNIIPFI